MTVTPSSSGEGGIRTLDDPEAIPVFETGAFSRSATSPWWCFEPFGVNPDELDLKPYSLSREAIPLKSIGIFSTALHCPPVPVKNGSKEDSDEFMVPRTAGA